MKTILFFVALSGLCGCAESTDSAAQNVSQEKLDDKMIKKITSAKTIDESLERFQKHQWEDETCKQKAQKIIEDKKIAHDQNQLKSIQNIKNKEILIESLGLKWYSEASSIDAQKILADLIDKEIDHAFLQRDIAFLETFLMMSKDLENQQQKATTAWAFAKIRHCAESGNWDCVVNGWIKTSTLTNYDSWKEVTQQAVSKALDLETDRFLSIFENAHRNLDERKQAGQHLQQLIKLHQTFKGTLPSYAKNIESRLISINKKIDIFEKEQIRLEKDLEKKLEYERKRHEDIIKKNPDYGAIEGSGSGTKKCVDGKLCGNTCINRNKICHK